MPSSLIFKAYVATDLSHLKGIHPARVSQQIEGQMSHFQKEQLQQALGLDSPWHSTAGSPQNSSWHSRQVRPPKPGMQWHCPVNCQNTTTTGDVTTSAA